MRIKKGTMINVKKALGILLGIFIANEILNINFLTDLITKYYILVLIVMAFSSFFLIRSGRQL